MESLESASFWNGWDLSKAILILLLIVNIVSADVRISNSYSTSGSESRENVILHNMDYSNTASIFNDNYNANSRANTANESEISNFNNIINSNSVIGASIADLQLGDSNDLGYSRSLLGGTSQLIGFSYSLESGSEPTDLSLNYLDTQVHYSDDVSNLVNNHYQGSFQSYNSNIFSSNSGRSNGKAPSGFNDVISLEFLGKSCEMDSFLEEFAGNNPAEYVWKSTFSKRGTALVDLRANAYQGNPVYLGIKGTSVSTPDLPDKFSPVSYFDPSVPANNLKALPSDPATVYMQYELDQY